MSNVDIIKDTRRSKADIWSGQCGFQELVMTSEDRQRLLRKSTEAYYESLEFAQRGPKIGCFLFHFSKKRICNIFWRFKVTQCHLGLATLQ